MNECPTTVVSATVVTTNRGEVADVMRAFAEAAADLAADGIDVSVSATVAPDAPDEPDTEPDPLDAVMRTYAAGGLVPPVLVTAHNTTTTPEHVDLGDDPDGDNS